MESKVDNLFDEAIQKLEQAHQELYRPEEDVVSFLVCKNAQFAIENFLRGFLIQNNIDSSKYKTIDGLYEQCKLINEKFEEVNLSGFDCKSVDTDSRYCNGTTKVSRCFDIANSLDTFFRREKIIS